MKRNKLIVGIGLLLIGVFALYGFANAEITYVTDWGSYGTEQGEFWEPRDIAVDSTGNVYVADTLNDRIQKFTSDGAPLITWGTEGSAAGELQNPYGIAIDSTDTVYVADTDNHRIQKFTSSGTLIPWTIEDLGSASFYNPRGIAVDAADNVYVADTRNDRIQKFDSTGAFVTMWGGNGTGAGEFIDPSAIAVDSAGIVYVADVGNFRIQKFTSGGTLIPWAGEDLGTTYFPNPYGIAVDAADNVYVADTDNHRIQQFDSTEGFLTMWGSWDTDSFDTPTGIATCSQFIYVADHDDELTNHRIVKFTQVTAIEATIDIDPDTINLKSKGNWVTCYIELPDGYDVSDIDVSTIMLTIGETEILWADTPSPTATGDYDNNDIPDLMVKFSRQLVHEAVTEGPGLVTMTVSGALTGGIHFEGSDSVLVIDKGREHMDEVNHSSVEY